MTDAEIKEKIARVKQFNEQAGRSKGAVIARYGGKLNSIYHYKSIITELAIKYNLRVAIDAFGGSGAFALACSNLIENPLNRKRLFDFVIYNEKMTSLCALFLTVKNDCNTLNKIVENRCVNKEMFKSCQAAIRYLLEEPVKIDEGHYDRDIAIPFACAQYIVSKCSYNYDDKFFRKNTPQLKPITDKARNEWSRIKVLNEDALDLIKSLSDDELKYSLLILDPPYIHNTRADNADAVYEVEMQDKEHEEFLDLIINKVPHFILCGYLDLGSSTDHKNSVQCEENIYSRLNDIDSIKIKTFETVASSGFSRGLNKNASRTEYIWYR